MSTQALPSTLDIRRAAARGVEVGGRLKPADLPRFRQLLAQDEGVIEAHLATSRDEQGRDLVTVVIAAELAVICQRCLGPMPLSLASENTLAVVRTDEQAAQLPRELEPLLVEDETCNLWDLVEEELILALPAFSYHETDDCKKILKEFSAPAAAGQEAAKDKPNPFEVLGQLKPGGKI